jgi:spermidine/putrescine transport system ATP-binding protein
MLKLNNIHFDYQNSKGKFEVEIKATQFETSLITCVLGKNGSGKTTILNLIGGHLMAKEGDIILFDKDITHLKAQDRPTSTVFQQIGLFPHLSVRENIEMAIEPNTLFKKSISTKKQAKKILEEFKLTEFEKRLPSQLSLGQQQRVAIARALSSGNPVLLLDEPTSALDFYNINYLKSLLNEIKAKGTVPIIVIVSHDLPFVLDIADNIKFIENGKLVFEGTSQAFQSSNWYLN